MKIFSKNYSRKLRTAALQPSPTEELLASGTSDSGSYRDDEAMKYEDPIMPPLIAPAAERLRLAAPCADATVFGVGSLVQGARICSGDNIRVSGRMIDVTVCGIRRLEILVDGSFTGEISAEEVLVAGKIQGNVVATKHVHIAESGRINGDVQCGRISCSSGGVVNGVIRKTA